MRDVPVQESADDQGRTASRSRFRRPKAVLAAGAATAALALLSGAFAISGSSAATPGSGHHAMAIPTAYNPNLDPGESDVVSELPPLVPSTVAQPKNVGFHEFQANCSVNRVAADDPIVYPSHPGLSHSHTFTGGATDAYSTTGSLLSSRTSCSVPGDRSAYWFPTMYNGDREILPLGEQIVYYKSGVADYNSVRPFPNGLRFVLGSPTATAAEFERDSGVSGWACGTSADNWDFPASCPAGSRLLVRYKAPSCWDGVHLDSPDHKSHMAYPVKGVCPSAHPIAVPMLEYKIAYPVNGNLSQLRLASGRGYSWHADFFAAWDAGILQRLVTQCINGGAQCDADGYDRRKPERGRVLDPITHELM